MRKYDRKLAPAINSRKLQIGQLFISSGHCHAEGHFKTHRQSCVFQDDFGMDDVPRHLPKTAAHEQCAGHRTDT